MSCNETRKLLSEYMDDGLSRGAAESVRLHILKCGKCSAELKQMKENSAALSRLSEEEVPEEFYRGLEAKLDGAELPFWKKLGPVFTLRNTAALASGVLIGLIAGGIIFHSGTNSGEKVALTKVVIPAGEMAKADRKIEEMKKKYDASADAGAGNACQADGARILPKRYVVELDPGRMDMFMNDLKSVGAVSGPAPYGMKAGFGAVSGPRNARIEFELIEETQPAGTSAQGSVSGGR